MSLHKDGVYAQRPYLGSHWLAHRSAWLTAWVDGLSSGISLPIAQCIIRVIVCAVTQIHKHRLVAPVAFDVATRGTSCSPPACASTQDTPAHQAFAL